MSQQGDAFVRRVLKADPSPMSFDDAVKYVRQREGSGRRAAARLGVNESTLRKWAKGATPKGTTQQKVLEAVRGLRSRPSALGDAGVLVPIVSKERKRKDRGRDVSGNQLKLRPGTLARAHREWIRTGDADKAAAVFVAGIGDPWYQTQLAKGLVRSQEDGGGGGGGGGAGGGGGGAGGGGPVDEDLSDDVDPDFDLGDDYGMSFG